jgi:hypothetical protein
MNAKTLSSGLLAPVRAAPYNGNFFPRDPLRRAAAWKAHALEGRRSGWIGVRFVAMVPAQPPIERRGRTHRPHASAARIGCTIGSATSAS